MFKLTFPARNSLAMLAMLATMAIAFVTPNVQAQEYVQWSFDLDQATQVAASENKLVLLHFTATWCAPCKELDRFVFVNPITIRAIAAHVIPVKIDVDAQKNLADKYEITSVPTDVIITPSGHIVSRQPSPRSTDGYLQLLSQAKTSSETISKGAFEGQTRIRQAISVNHPIDAGLGTQQNNSGFQASSGGNFAPSGNQASGNSTVTNKFFPGNQGSPSMESQNQNLNQSQNQNQSQIGNIAPGSIYSNQQGGAFTPMNPLTVRNEYSTGNGTNGSGSLAASPNTREGGMLRVQNPYTTVPEESPALEMNAIAESPAPTSDSVSINQSETHAVSLPPIGLEGYCGVALMEDQSWVKGDERFGCIHRGKLYFFASQEHLDQFQMTPDMFSPLLGGSDPVSFHDSGALIEGKRKLGIFYGEPGEPSLIVLFDSEENRKRFEADPPIYVQSVRQAMSQVDRNTLIR